MQNSNLIKMAVITVRLPLAGREQLKEEAKAAKVSLNQLCVQRLLPTDTNPTEEASGAT